MSRICCKGIKFFPSSYWLQETKKTGNISIMLKIPNGMMIFIIFSIIGYLKISKSGSNYSSAQHMKMYEDFTELSWFGTCVHPLWMSVIQNDTSILFNTQNIHKESWHLIVLTQRVPLTSVFSWDNQSRANA